MIKGANTAAVGWLGVLEGFEEPYLVGSCSKTGAMVRCAELEDSRTGICIALYVVQLAAKDEVVILAVGGEQNSVPRMLRCAHKETSNKEAFV